MPGKVKRHCGSHHTKVSAESAAKVRSVLPTVTDNPNQIIAIKVIFHMFYTQNVNNAKDDADAIISALNRDFGSDAYKTDPKGTMYGGKATLTTPDKSVYKNMLATSGKSNITFSTDRILYPVLSKPLADDDDTDAKDVAIKGTSPSISPDNYLNIWLVQGLGGGLLGYATFPWDLESNKNYDGVVIEKNAAGKQVSSDFSAYNMNRTVVHEVGHWLGLYHTFQSEPINSKSIMNVAKNQSEVPEQTTGDCVPDTPKQNNASFGNPFASKSWPYTVVRSGGKITKSWHMFMSYMDYSDDVALFMFTKEQVTRMRLIIRSFRKGLISS